MTLMRSTTPDDSSAYRVDAFPGNSITTSTPKGWKRVGTIDPVAFRGSFAPSPASVVHTNPTTHRKSASRRHLRMREALKDTHMEAQGINIIGINFKDTEAAATKYLRDDDNPFAGVGFDPQGRTAIDWGVTAPPETFILDAEGTVLFRFAGPLVGSDYEQRFVPAFEKALGN